MKFLKNITYSTIQMLSTLVLGFLYNVFIARVLGPKNMGEYTYFTWLISLLSYIILLGTPTTITKYISQFFYNEPQKIKLVFGLFKYPLIIFIITIFSIILYNFKIGLNLQVGTSWLIIGVIILISDNIINSVASGIQNFKILMFGKIISLSFYLFTLFLILKKYPFVSSVIYLYIAHLIIHTFFVFYSIRKEIFKIINQSNLFNVQKDEFVNVFNYYKYVSVAIILDYIVWQNSEIFFIKIYNTPHEIAFYSIGFTISYLPSKILGSAFSSVSMPLMSSLYGIKNTEKLNYSYTLLTQYLAFFLIPIYVFIFFYAKDIITIIYGEKYLVSANVMKIIIFAGLVGGISSIGSGYVHAVEKPQIIVRIGWIVAILNIFLNILLIPKYGCIGAAIGNTIAQVSACFAGILYIVSKYELTFPLIKLIKYFILSILLCYLINIGFFNIKMNFIKVILFFIFYFICFISVIILIFKEERKDITQIIKNLI